MLYFGYEFSPSVVDMLLSDSSCRSAVKPGRADPVRRIPVDILERDTEFEIVADVPGVHKDAIHLDIDKETLTISVSQPDDSQAKPTAEEPAKTRPDENDTPAQPKVLLRERTQRFAKRALKLPETADLGQAQAGCEGGLLTVTVPKRALPSPHRIAIA